MFKKTTRRDFLQKAGAAGVSIAGLGMGGQTPQRVAANAKLNVAFIGVANRGQANIEGVVGRRRVAEDINVVALCDVDETHLAGAARRFPEAKTFHDFRRMLDRIGRDIDAVVVATPDHIHAPASMAAIDLGKHVYCEKPLTHSVHEARSVAMAAKRAGVATQLGTQIHADPNYRRVVEIVQSGAIGPVREVHVWIDKAWAGGRRPAGAFAPPSSMHWDLWLGPAPHRPYFPEIYHPMNWRRWWDFGSGTLGDMACHFMDLPFWALDLRHPTSIEADAEPFNPETCPHNLRVQYEFPARGDTPPVKLTWHDDTRVPPPLADLGVAPWSNGVLFIGDKGKLLADYTRYKLLPEAEFAGFVPPDPWIPDSIGHHREWIEACKTGSPTTCNFDYSGALTEAVLLGTVAYRVGHRIDWDAERFKATNCEEAGRFLRREYREGW